MGSVGTMDGKLMLALAGDLALSREDEAMLTEAAVGGVILFERNFASSAQLRGLTADIRRAAGREVLIVTDHEGGRVQRFRKDAFFHAPAMRRLASVADAPAALHAAGVVIGADLMAHGVDMTFAPVLDLDWGKNAAIGDRALAADGALVGELAAAFCAGLDAAGMNACGKHFPGHGFVAADSHVALPVDGRGLDELRAADMLPFVRFAADGGAALMTAHVVYEKVCERAATFSAVWLRQVLREEMRFGGLVVSDDLCMQGAVQAGASIEERMRAAAQAGCDLLLACDAGCNADALAAAGRMAEDGGAGGWVQGGNWQQLRRASTERLCVGEPEYARAKQTLAALANG